MSDKQASGVERKPCVQCGRLTTLWRPDIDPPKCTKCRISQGDGADRTCPDCGATMEQVDPEETAGPPAWECRECGRAVREGADDPELRADGGKPAYGRDCPHCGFPESETVDTRIKGRGSLETIAVRECQQCGQLWGEPRDFYGVVDGE